MQVLNAPCTLLALGMIQGFCNVSICTGYAAVQCDPDDVSLACQIWCSGKGCVSRTFLGIDLLMPCGFGKVFLISRSFVLDPSQTPRGIQRKMLTRMVSDLAQAGVRLDGSPTIIHAEFDCQRFSFILFIR